MRLKLAIQDVPAEQCIFFQSGKTDSHAAFDAKTKYYTIVQDGEYIYTYSKVSMHKKAFKAGDVIYDPYMVMSKGCGNFYEQGLVDVKLTELRKSETSMNEILSYIGLILVVCGGLIVALSLIL